ncbi:MAG: hypothetical protein ACK40G_05365 [Cytophagaceae bacterium]
MKLGTILKIKLLTILLISGCAANDQKEGTTTQIENPPVVSDCTTIQIKNELTKTNNFYYDNEFIEELLEPKEFDFDNYKFIVGYEKYDEKKYNFSNPGYLKVYKDEELIFNDSFKGEGNVYVKHLGVHELAGSKTIFTLNWGTEACDYVQHSRYYYINSQDKVTSLNEYWSATGGDGYASRYFHHILPDDSLGIPNTLLIVEGMIFHEQDQPDQSDTTKITFFGNGYRSIKLTNNLAKVKK